jgi:hydroxypyruvate isomerase
MGETPRLIDEWQVLPKLWDHVRHEIDERQELNYPAIMRAIVATGYKGYVAQEFMPADKDPIASLTKAIKICDV